MREYLPVLIVAAIISVFATVFVAAYLRIKNKKEALGFDRHMEDGELILSEGMKRYFTKNDSYRK